MIVWDFDSLPLSRKKRHSCGVGREVQGPIGAGRDYTEEFGTIATVNFSVTVHDCGSRTHSTTNLEQSQTLTKNDCTNRRG